MSKPCSVMWFRQDLRVQDNPALNYAAASGSVIPVYIVDEVSFSQWQMGAASKWWLHHSLISLNKSLKGNLRIFSGDPKEIIAELVNKTGAKSVVWNRCYEPQAIKRDTKIKKTLQEMQVDVHSCNGSLLWEPWTILKKDSTPYKVFTPYYRRGCLVGDPPRQPEKTSAQLTFSRKDVGGLEVADLDLVPTIPWYSAFTQRWQPGEKGAAQKLKQFLKESACEYKGKRDIPAVTGTSLLSPHLHFGEVSPNQIWYDVLGAIDCALDNEHTACYLSELGWREFSYYLLYHFPTLPEENFQRKFNQFPWQRKNKLVVAWQQGQTGIPIVDAGMRELWQTGYVHNRVRMIVGSFLVKNLLQHWRHGATWFWDCLLDADLASNSASWQWVAGSGADAAPYFRIFNPVTQGEKFDPDGEYVRRYCPELDQLPNRWIHKPWDADEQTLGAAGVLLGKNYPKPVVDLKLSRQRALDAFAELKGLAP